LKDKISDFDKEYQKEKRKKVALIGTGVFIFLAFCAFILYMSLPDHMPGTINVHGTMTAETSVDTVNGKSPAVKVTLDSGEEITILNSEGLSFTQNRKIILKKVTSTAGIDSYYFINYLQ